MFRRHTRFTAVSVWDKAMQIPEGSSIHDIKCSNRDGEIIMIARSYVTNTLELYSSTYNSGWKRLSMKPKPKCHKKEYCSVSIIIDHQKNQSYLLYEDYKSRYTIANIDLENQIYGDSSEIIKGGGAEFMMEVNLLLIDNKLNIFYKSGDVHNGIFIRNHIINHALFQNPSAPKPHKTPKGEKKGETDTKRRNNNDNGRIIVTPASTHHTIHIGATVLRIKRMSYLKTHRALLILHDNQYENVSKQSLNLFLYYLDTKRQKWIKPIKCEPFDVSSYTLTTDEKYVVCIPNTKHTQIQYINIKTNVAHESKVKSWAKNIENGFIVKQTLRDRAVVTGYVNQFWTNNPCSLFNHMTHPPQFFISIISSYYQNEFLYTVKGNKIKKVKIDKLFK